MAEREGVEVIRLFGIRLVVEMSMRHLIFEC